MTQSFHWVLHDLEIWGGFLTHLLNPKRPDEIDEKDTREVQDQAQDTCQFFLSKKQNVPTQIQDIYSPAFSSQLLHSVLK